MSSPTGVFPGQRGHDQVQRQYLQCTRATRLYIYIRHILLYHYLATDLSIYQSINLSINLSIYQSINQSVNTDINLYVSCITRRRVSPAGVTCPVASTGPSRTRCPTGRSVPWRPRCRAVVEGDMMTTHTGMVWMVAKPVKILHQLIDGLSMFIPLFKGFNHV